MSKALELAKKLKALADRGEGGEKVNAQMQLERIIKLHGITIEQVEGEEKKWAYFKVSKTNRSLFIQVVSSVLNEVKTYSDSNRKGYVVLNCTAAESIEIRFKFDFYWKLYQEELDIFYTAFIHKNDIYHPNGRTLNPTELSQSELERLQRVKDMVRGIKKGELLKQIA